MDSPQSVAGPISRTFDEGWGVAPQVSVWAKRRRKFLRFVLYNPVAVLAAIMLVGIVFVVVFADQLPLDPPLKANPLVRLQGPSTDHWFGTDSVGRDVMSRLIYGGRTRSEERRVGKECRL